MNCSQTDLQDYYFEALPAAERHAVDDHLGRCEECAAELARIRLTGLALSSIPEEELPRRIGFVSDKVFEPSPVVRWWQSFWLSGARVTAASMALLAIAILVHAFRPVPVIAVTPTPIATVSSHVDSAALQSSIDAAVAKAVRVTEARYDVKLNQIAAENTRQKLMIERAAETIDTMDRRARVMMVASNRETEPAGGQ